MSEMETMRAELARMKEENELMQLKAQLAATLNENATLAAALTTEGEMAPVVTTKKRKSGAGEEGSAPKEKKKKKKKVEVSEEGAAAGDAPKEKKKKPKGTKAAAAAAASAAAALAAETVSNEKAAKEVPEHRTCYVGGLPYNEDAASIKEHFARECGSVRHVRLKEFDGEPGSFCGIAFVAFETDAGFIAALKQDGVAFREDDERVLKIRPDRSALARRAPPPRVGNSTTVYIGNLAYDMEHDAVKALFEDNGCGVRGMRYHTDPETKGFRGFCHVELEDEAALAKALALAGTWHNNRELRISYSESGKKPQENKPDKPDGKKGGRGGRGGRGGGRGKGGKGKGDKARK